MLNNTKNENRCKTGFYDSFKNLKCNLLKSSIL